MGRISYTMFQWLFLYHKDLFDSILSEIDESLLDEYLEWTHTDEGRSYLVGGYVYVNEL